MNFNNWQGVNNFSPDHHTIGGDLTVAQNAVIRGKSIKKINGTSTYADGMTARVPWVARYYGRMGDGSRVNKTFMFSGGKIYYRPDGVTTTAEVVKDGFDSTSRPESVLVQKAGQVVLMVFSGLDTPYEYNGNGDNTFTPNEITQKFVQGVWWLDRLWAFEDNSSDLYYSKTRFPSDFTDSTDAGFLRIGSAKTNSYIVAIMLLGDILFVFKNTGIFHIEGRVPSRFAVRVVTDTRGLATRRAIAKVGSAVVFLQRQDFHLYEFTGTETGFKKLSTNINLPSLLNTYRLDDISMVWHNELFRMAYNDVRDGKNYATREVIFPTDDFRQDGNPKWSETKGANIDCYEIMDDEVDNGELITGRSDTGEVSIHDTSKDWGSTAIEFWVKTKAQINKLGYNTEFLNCNVNGSPHNMTLEMRYYTDSRDSVRETEILDQRGVTTSSGIGGFAQVSAQARYNDYIQLKTGYNMGESLSLEFYDNTVGKDVEIYEVYVETIERGRKISKVTGG